MDGPILQAWVLDCIKLRKLTEAAFSLIILLLDCGMQYDKLPQAPAAVTSPQEWIITSNSALQEILPFHVASVRACYHNNGKKVTKTLGMKKIYQ